MTNAGCEQPSSRVKVGGSGKVNLYNSRGSTHVVADVAGWYGD